MLHYRLERESRLSDEIVMSLPRPSNRPEKILEGSTIEEMGIVIDRLIHKKHRRGPAVHPPALISTICRMASRDRLRALRGKAAGDESLVRRRFRGRRRPELINDLCATGSLFSDQSEGWVLFHKIAQLPKAIIARVEIGQQ